ncbi:hypothetical protein G5716_18985 [Bacillus pacificus]|nr:hypothetical protein [Bacillus pacificus]
MIGTGGISSTAEDVVRFSQIFMGQGKEILSNKAVKAMEQEEYKKECGREIAKMWSTMVLAGIV